MCVCVCANECLKTPVALVRWRQEAPWVPSLSVSAMCGLNSGLMEAADVWSTGAAVMARDALALMTDGLFRGSTSTRSGSASNQQRPRQTRLAMGPACQGPLLSAGGPGSCPVTQTPSPNPHPHPPKLPPPTPVCLARLLAGNQSATSTLGH